MRMGLLVLMIAGCSQVHTAPVVSDTAQSEPEPLYIPGERATWELRWLNVVMGKLTMAVGQPGTVQGRPAIVVRMQAATAGVLAHVRKAKSELAATLDTTSGQAIKTSGNIDGLFTGDVTRQGYRARRPGLRWRRYYNAYYLEWLGALGLVRAAWTGTLGQLGFIPVSVRGRRYHLEMIAKKRERILSRKGPVNTVRIEGVLRNTGKGRHYPYVTWISDDDRRIFIRAKIQSGWMGTVEAELTGYSAWPK